MNGRLLFGLVLVTLSFGCAHVPGPNELLHHCYWYRTEASKAVEVFQEIDMLHIDGNHAHESATGDVNLYVPKVKSGGYIWFDDIDWDSTQGALNTLYKDLRYIKTVDRTAVFQKP